VKLKRALKAEDIVGLVGVGLILAGVLLLVFAGMAARRVAKPFPGGSLNPIRLQAKVLD